jgi:hypothetical protein
MRPDEPPNVVVGNIEVIQAGVSLAAHPDLAMRVVVRFWKSKVKNT